MVLVYKNRNQTFLRCWSIDDLIFYWVSTRKKIVIRNRKERERKNSFDPFEVVRIGNFFVSLHCHFDVAFVVVIVVVVVSIYWIRFKRSFRQRFCIPNRGKEDMISIDRKKENFFDRQRFKIRYKRRLVSISPTFLVIAFSACFNGNITG